MTTIKAKRTKAAKKGEAGKQAAAQEQRNADIRKVHFVFGSVLATHTHTHTQCI
jgi:hypothetical protein